MGQDVTWRCSIVKIPDVSRFLRPHFYQQVTNRQRSEASDVFCEGNFKICCSNARKPTDTEFQANPSAKLRCQFSADLNFTRPPSRKTLFVFGWNFILKLWIRCPSSGLTDFVSEPGWNVLLEKRVLPHFQMIPTFSPHFWHPRSPILADCSGSDQAELCFRKQDEKSCRFLKISSISKWDTKMTATSWSIVKLVSFQNLWRSCDSKVPEMKMSIYIFVIPRKVGSKLKYYMGLNDIKKRLT